MFRPIKDVKVYELVIEQIKNMIIEGKLKRGDKLPSERELVEQLQVSRASIREALSALQIIGLIECRHGEGNFIKEKLDNNFLEPLSTLFLLEERSPQEILEFRTILEVSSAAMAAKNATPEQILMLQKVVKDLEENRNDENLNIKLDKKFHYTIAQITGNRLLFNILNSISDLIDISIKYTRSKILMDPQNQEILIEQHKGIFAAIAKGDPELASERMKSHLDYVNKCIIEYEEKRPLSNSL
ncbi:GntR family transcriptional regulator, transcriptional repressor for pyruvate dehydrogenase complex [Anaerobranca californiensis DSM 14826]|uniref:GntR family transcriptional regulator, transcriptional repressor for pyruvate dehydrogenase complex n=1 Tax=Anaerobranca californiensis DSM 14826 TaxID=1120989 RepID=A0A1M6NUL0_9FIRM|nr:FadR/GntR family transcriptional regulator [Anaerobranca californiensis]SHJ99407.1 GntR family transcriptional regulator, transcriptional repressor for pyruvate dehydrogenase complex [Anaerobranca californiensis DSM 14826]